MGDLIAYLQSDNAGRGAEPVYFEPGSPRRGQELFSTKRCTTCHAVAGKGGRSAPDLGTGLRELVRSVSEIAGLMWNHSQGMTAEFERRGIERATFSGQEMADIISYLYFVNYANVRGQPARGGRLFVNHCSTCHSVGGGRRVGPDLAAAPGLDEPIAIIAAMWNHAPTMEQELQKRQRPWPRFEVGDAADLMAFLVTSRVAAPSRSRGELLQARPQGAAGQLATRFLATNHRLAGRSASRRMYHANHAVP
jgi:mono/diheme cytochrome c family protein